MKQIIFLVFLAITVLSCNNEKSKQSKSHNLEKQSDANLFYSTEFGYSLSLPNTWLRLDDGSDTNEIIKKLMGDFYQQSIKYEAVYTKSGKKEPTYPFIVLYSKESFLPDNLNELAKIAGAGFFPENNLSISEKIIKTASDTTNKMLIDRKEKMMYISNKLELPGSQEVKMLITICFGNQSLVSLACYYTETTSSTTIKEYATSVQTFKWDRGKEYLGN